jgi:hypothetical protein
VLLGMRFLERPLTAIRVLCSLEVRLADCLVTDWFSHAKA